MPDGTGSTTSRALGGMELLVGASEFWARLSADIAAARDYAFVQTLSFEGDRVGTALVDAMQAATCRDRRILVDSFTRVILSDRFRFTPGAMRDAALRAEWRATTDMIARAETAGVGVRFTNPLGPLLLRLPARNHKKIMVIDDRVAYIGGINFSEHNFAWHDMMLRIEAPGAAAFLRDDFLATWEGKDLGRSAAFDGLELHTVDGRPDSAAFARIFALVDGARERIFIESPYVSFPFAERLARARRRGVEVTLVSPGENNHALVGRYVRWEAARLDLDLRLYRGGMTHLKAMLIDDRTLVVGSSNFDWLSYYLHQDVVGVVSDPALVAEFRRRVEVPDLAHSVRPDRPVHPLSGRMAHLQLQTAMRLSRVALRLTGTST
jgi:cardiolipin synthase